MRLLTIKDLADRWQTSEQTIRNYLNDGTISSIKNLPVIRFSVEYIESIEMDIGSKKTPYELRLEKELEKVTNELDRVKKLIISSIGRLSEGVNVD